jgi:hypothetical protein
LNKGTAAITPEKGQGQNQYGRHYSKEQNFKRIRNHGSSSANGKNEIIRSIWNIPGIGHSSKWILGGGGSFQASNI